MILVRVALPFVIWSSAFLALYILHALGCRFGWEGATRVAMLAALLGHLATLLVLMRWRPAVADLPTRLVRPLDIAALIAMLWLGAPVLLLATCGP